MSRVSFENYGKLAQTLEDDTIISGRYKIQAEAEKYVVKDILNKLDLQPADSVLEIGCGTGNLLIPISFFVSEISGIDHEACLKRLEERFPKGKNISLIPGNFLDVSLSKKYDIILCYSVLHYLSGRDEVFTFIDKALEYLAPGGKALFGDVPNISAKTRFVDSAEGKRFVKEWEVVAKGQGEAGIAVPSDESTVHFDDDLVTDIIKIFRKKGYHTYILPQSPKLPFGNTREDILIKKVG
ncbi:MAG: methyltransferase domain-containing protein [Nitrospirae bacterium]|nr:methyltransferase domain-containing protein [Nitrospirota bacterium]